MVNVNLSNMAKCLFHKSIKKKYILFCVAIFLSKICFDNKKTIKCFIVLICNNLTKVSTFQNVCAALIADDFNENEYAIVKIILKKFPQITFQITNIMLFTQC